METRRKERFSFPGGLAALFSEKEFVLVGVGLGAQGLNLERGDGMSEQVHESPGVRVSAFSIMSIFFSDNHLRFFLFF